jgi:hypothetical protein
MISATNSGPLSDHMNCGIPCLMNILAIKVSTNTLRESQNVSVESERVLEASLNCSAIESLNAFDKLSASS